MRKIINLIVLISFTLVLISWKESSGKAEEHFQKGLKSYQQEDYKKAINYYTKAIQVDQKNADAYLNRGNTHSEKGDYDKAIKDYNKYLKLKPKASDADEVKRLITKHKVSLLVEKKKNKSIPILSYILLVCLTVALVAALVIYLVLRVKRKCGYKTLAEKLGLMYGSPDGVDIPLPSWSSDSLRAHRHMITGTVDKINIAICDAKVLDSIRYGLSGRRDYCSTTAVILSVSGLALPTFEISPRDKSSDWLSGQKGITQFADIDFVDSNNITGADSVYYSKVINSEFQALLRDNRTMTVHVEDDVLVLYRYRKIMSFEEIEQALELGKKLVIALLSNRNRELDSATEVED